MPSFALLVSSSKSTAAIEFIGSDTTAQVETVAGSMRTSGGQETLSTGVIRNTIIASVPENSLGEGRGSGSAEISVDPIGQPTELFAFMQVAATALAQDNTGTFAEARVTYFFSNPIEIEVETGIRQGDSRFFIDSVQQTSSAIKKVTAAAKILSKSKRRKIANATAALSEALADFKKVKGADARGRRVAKSNLLKANQTLLDLINQNF